MINNSNLVNRNHIRDSSVSVSLDNVSIKYGDSIAVKNVFCDIKRNQVTSFDQGK